MYGVRKAIATINNIELTFEMLKVKFKTFPSLFMPCRNYHAHSNNLFAFTWRYVFCVVNDVDLDVYVNDGDSVEPSL